MVEKLKIDGGVTSVFSENTVTSFLISPQKTYIVVLIRSASVSHF